MDAIKKHLDGQNRSVLDVFQASLGFYIPAYQRPYSWTDQQVEKLIDDILRGAREDASGKRYELFLGILILLHKTAITGLHISDSRVSYNVLEVVDGQQRLTTLAVLGAVLESMLDAELKKIQEICPTPEVSALKSLTDRIKGQLNELQCFRSPSDWAWPEKKPKVIRARNGGGNPVADQWRLNESDEEAQKKRLKKIKKESDYPLNDLCYESDIAIFLNHRVAGISIEKIIKRLASSKNNEVLRKAVVGIAAKLADELEKNEAENEAKWLTAVFSNQNTSNKELLEGCKVEIDSQPNLSDEARIVYLRSMQLMSWADYLLHRCWLQQNLCTSSELAFDFFQTLNGTGTPLTSFEIAKPELYRLSHAANEISKIQTGYLKPIEDYFSEFTKDGEKNKETSDTVFRVAYVFSGKTSLGGFTSTQREYLIGEIKDSDVDKLKEFFAFFKNTVDFQRTFLKGKAVEKPRGSAQNPDRWEYPIEHEVQRYIKNPDDAKVAAFCFHFIRVAQHKAGYYPVLLFYHKVIQAHERGNHEDRSRATDDFLRVAKGVAAFYALWSAIGSGKFPDQIYRELFDAGAEGVSFCEGEANQTADFVLRHLRTSLEAHLAKYLECDPTEIKEKWVSKVAVQPLYNTRKNVAKFLLMVAHHHAALDQRSGREGLLVDDPQEVHSYFSVKRWEGPDLSSIEHIAQQRIDPNKLQFPDSYDQNIYEDIDNLHCLGNLTFLDAPWNSSIGDEWIHKFIFYWHLTYVNEGMPPETVEDLLKRHGVTKVSPGLAAYVQSTRFVAHLAPIVKVGLKGKTWDLQMIKDRSRNIGERACNTLFNWLS